MSSRTRVRLLATASAVMLAALGACTSGPVRPTTPSPFARGLDDEVHDAPEAEGPLGDTLAETAYFKEVFAEFVGLKKTCGESIAGLTLAKFAGKLRKNRDDLRAKKRSDCLRLPLPITT